VGEGCRQGPGARGAPRPCHGQLLRAHGLQALKMRRGPGGEACSLSALQALRWRIQECGGELLRPPRMSKFVGRLAHRGGAGLLGRVWRDTYFPAFLLRWGRRRERAAAAARAARGRAGRHGAVGAAGSHRCPRAAIMPGMGRSPTWRLARLGPSGVHQAAWAPARGPADAWMCLAEPLCACSGRTHMGFDPRLRSSCGIKLCS